LRGSHLVHPDLIIFIGRFLSVFCWSFRKKEGALAWFLGGEVVV
jgi:hypothetical protein